MPILISGSLAYDFIMDFPDSFRNHILPEQIHILNVCFVVDKVQKNFGGCAGNIAYTMNLLGAQPLVLSPLGNDGADYLQKLKKDGLDTDYITTVADRLTASAYITTDKDDNQIIAYYNGAADLATNLTMDAIKENVSLALITPTKKEAMLAHAKQCFDKKIPFVFDPSHQLTAFTPQELMQIIGQAKYYIANDYEMKLTQEKTGWDQKEMLTHVDVLIITKGVDGSVIYTKDEQIEVGICPVQSADDPTGAGDAYRAGFFAALNQGHDWRTCGQVGAVAASYAIEHYGTQNHSFTIAEFKDRFVKAFGRPLIWGAEVE
ncbi:MAG TPA: carbohydrate kinase family protein [Patescibacteria group bacterium]|nr:carbohydrate kinase family protein [Patescibacteria group bacterium]